MFHSARGPHRYITLVQNLPFISLPPSRTWSAWVTTPRLDLLFTRWLAIPSLAGRLRQFPAMEPTVVSYLSHIGHPFSLSLSLSLSWCPTIRIRHDCMTWCPLNSDRPTEETRWAINEFGHSHEQIEITQNTTAAMPFRLCSVRWCKANC